MKIAFFQREWFENIGIMSLSAVLKKANYTVEVFVESGEKDIFVSLKKFDPQIACFSCTTGEHLWALETAKKLKTLFDVTTVFGGPHPTFFPDMIEEPQVDAVCRGEGDYPLLELVKSIDKGVNSQSIKNFYFKKKNGAVVKNELAQLIENLDDLPYPARDIYDKYPEFQKNPTKHFIASRGCPFNCSYCYSHILRDMYGGKGKFIRFRSPDHVIAELKHTKERYALRTAFFDDDVLIFNKKWLFEFLEKYKKEIRVPFICNVQAAVMTDEIAKKMREAGCFRISMGVETGDETLRRTVLKKNVTDKQIIDAAYNLRKNGIKILTNNMMCLPGETVEQAFKTIKINIKIGTEYPWCSILQPYPDTEIEKYAIENGFMNARDHKQFSSTFFKDSPLEQKNVDELVNLQKFFYLAIKFPFLIPLIKVLIKLPLRPLYHFIFLLTFAYRYKTANRLTLFEIIQFGLRNLPLYTKKIKSSK